MIVKVKLMNIQMFDFFKRLYLFGVRLTIFKKILILRYKIKIFDKLFDFNLKIPEFLNIYKSLIKLL